VSAPAALPIGPRRVLVVDDMPAIHDDFRKILTPARADAGGLAAIDALDALEAELFDAAPKDTATPTQPGFALDSALQGREALERVREATAQGQPYALAFVDMRMPPGWDGVETIEHLWQVDPALQVVICTAYTDYAWEDVLCRLGAHEKLIILKKPFDAIEVSQLAHTLVAKWQADRQVARHTQELEDEVQRQTAALRQANARLETELAERVQRQAALQLADSVFCNTVNGIVVTDERSRIVSVNPAFTTLTGYGADEAVGQSLALLRDDSLPPGTHRAQWAELLAQGRWSGELWNRRKDGSLFCEWLNISRVPMDDGQPQRFVGIMVDVTERRRRDEHLRHQALHDPLTGLANRTQLIARLEEALSRAEREHGVVGLLFIDLDRFKPINDELGHDVGDAVLREVAVRLQALIRRCDLAARFGGDEFVLLLEQLDDIGAAERVATRALACLAQPVIVGTHELQIGASIGIAGGQGSATDAASLMKQADAAMYIAKAEGRQRWHRVVAERRTIDDPAAHI
jgi:diguanylate cyclase (GGDEF)-like protein/PAS domain S-box-containing protein